MTQTAVAGIVLWVALAVAFFYVGILAITAPDGALFRQIGLPKRAANSPRGATDVVVASLVSRFAGRAMLDGWLLPGQE